MGEGGGGAFTSPSLVPPGLDHGVECVPLHRLLSRAGGRLWPPLLLLLLRRRELSRAILFRRLLRLTVQRSEQLRLSSVPTGVIATAWRQLLLQ